MPIFNLSAKNGFLLAGLLLLVAAVVAFYRPGDRIIAPIMEAKAPKPVAAFKSELPEGHALYALERRAHDGDLESRLALAKRYARGDGISKNEALAFAHFESIANQYPDIDPLEPRASFISEAFRNLAQFYKQGVPSINLDANPSYSVNLLQHSASYFGDPAAQFELARMILKGEQAERDTQIAVSWLLNASRKGFAPAQAMLGDMLWRGDGIKRVPGDGLGLLAVARENAVETDRDWVGTLFRAARSQASAEDVESAQGFIVNNGGFLRKSLMPGQPDSIGGPASLEALLGSGPINDGMLGVGATGGSSPLRERRDRRGELAGNLNEIADEKRRESSTGQLLEPQASPGPGEPVTGEAGDKTIKVADQAAAVSSSRNEPALDMLVAAPLKSSPKSN